MNDQTQYLLGLGLELFDLRLGFRGRLGFCGHGYDLW